MRRTGLLKSGTTFRAEKESTKRISPVLFSENSGFLPPDVLILNFQAGTFSRTGLFPGKETDCKCQTHSFMKTTSYLSGLLFLPLLFTCSEKKAGVGPSGGPRATPVEVMVLTPAELTDTYTTPGVLMANEEVDLHPETSGRILSILFTEGKAVSAGDLLIKINDADLQAQLKKNQSQIALAASVESRKRELLAGNLISREDYDNSLTALESLKADQDLLKAQIARTEVRAPFSGTAGIRSVSPGSYVTPATVLVTVVDLTPVKAGFSVPERLAASVSPGKAVTLELGSTGETARAVIYASDSKISRETGSLAVRARLNENRPGWLPGTQVSVKLGLTRLENALLLPAEAVVSDITGQIVYRVINGKADPVTVKTGVRTETRIQISEGLSEGDSVITSGLMQIRKGTPVQVRSAAKSQK